MVFYKSKLSARILGKKPRAVRCSSRKSNDTAEDQASTLRMGMAELLSCGLVSETRVIKVSSAEGGLDTRKEGK